MNQKSFITVVGKYLKAIGCVSFEDQSPVATFQQSDGLILMDCRSHPGRLKELYQCCHIHPFQDPNLKTDIK